MNGPGVSDGGSAGACSGGGGSSLHSPLDPLTGEVQHVLKLLIVEGFPLEYRWGNKKQWFKCTVSSVMSGEEGKGLTIELEFSPAQNSRTRRGRTLSEMLYLNQLLADGDVALPCVHLAWDEQSQMRRGKSSSVPLKMLSEFWCACRNVTGNSRVQASRLLPTIPSSIRRDFDQQRVSNRVLLDNQ